jgi:hypothetical protein
LVSGKDRSAILGNKSSNVRSLSVERINQPTPTSADVKRFTKESI